MAKEEQDYLLESLKTIRNLADISILLRESGRNDLLPTQLELLYIEIQELIAENCILDDGRNN